MSNSFTYFGVRSFRACGKNRMRDTFSTNASMFFPRVISSTVVWFTILLGCVCIPKLNLHAQSISDESSKAERELFVPFEELDILIGNDTNRVYMTRSEYGELKSLAHREHERELPLKQALLSARYKAILGDGRAMVTGEIELELLEEGWHAFLLPFEGVGILAAKLDDRPAALAKNEHGQTLLFANGVGRHRLTLDLVMPIQLDAAQQIMHFRLPSAPVGTLLLEVPGNIEVKSGAHVLRREFNSDLDKTEFSILPTGESMSLLLSLNNKILRENSTVISRGVLVSEVTQGYERVHATMSMQVMNGARDEFRFAIADGLEVNSVASELLSRWSIDRIDEQDILTVKLHSPTSERVLVNVRLDRPMKQLSDWQLPRFEPVDVAGYSAVIGLLIEDRLNAIEIVPTSLIAIDTKVLTAALPPSLLAAEKDSPELKAVAAFYAPNSRYGLTANFVAEPRKLTVNATSLLNVGEGGLTVVGGFGLLPKNEKLFFVDFHCPADWSIDWVRTSEQQELRFRRTESNKDTESSNGSRTARVRVDLPQGVSPNEQKNLIFQARYTPESWLGDWQTQAIELPQFSVVDAEVQRGAVAIQLQDDLAVTPITAEGLLVMTNDEKVRFHFSEIETSLAYRYDTALWNASVEVSRIVPRVSAHVLSFAQLQPESLSSHTELILSVDRARTRLIQFSLPASTPTELTIRGMDSVVVKATSSELVDARRVWTVQLAERQKGDLRLAIDFNQRLEEDASDRLLLPIVRAVGVDYQSGKIAVEGHAELEIELPAHPRAVDMGELVDAEYQVGKRLLGVYAYVGDDDAVLAKVKRVPVHRLPTTIIQRAELVSLVSAQGIHQTAARFLLRTKADYLEIRLPGDAELWAVVLDGKPALPQREREHVLIALPPLSETSLRDLQLVYESPIPDLGLRSSVPIVAPEIFEREGVAEVSLPVPIADLKWDLLPPSGYRVTAVSGRLAAQALTRGRFSLEGILNRLWVFGGGQTKTFHFGRAARPVENYAGDVQSTYDMPVASPPLSQAPASSLSVSNGLDASVVSGPEENSMADPFAAVPAPSEPSSPQKPVPPPQSQKAQASKPQKVAKLWALEGVRSLSIEIDSALLEDRIALTSLGVSPNAKATMLNQDRWWWISTAIGAAVFVIGAFCVSKAKRHRYVIGVVVMALLLPPLTGLEFETESWTANSMFAIFLLMVYWLLGSLISFAAGRIPHGLRRSPLHVPHTTMSLALFAVLVAHGSLVAQDQVAPMPSEEPPAVSSVDQLAALLERIGKTGKTTVPEDAIVVPYDPSQPPLDATSDKLLVPYTRYIELWNLAYPQKKLEQESLPLTHAWSDAGYTVTLEGDDSLRVVGSLTLEQFTERELAIPLAFTGCAIESASLDGKAPRLQAIAAQSQPAAQQAVEPNNTLVPDGFFMLYSQGKGSKRLQVSLRWKLSKRSGWRELEGIVPTGPACKLEILVPKTGTEVRLQHAMDRDSYETQKPNESIITALSTEGRISIRWRDKIAQTEIDQGLTVEARSVFDVQEDSLKFAWQGTFAFRNGQRDSLSLRIPADYLLEKIVGDNVRGWTVRENQGEQRVDVELLKAVGQQQRLSVFLSKQVTAQHGDGDLSVPQITVPEAMLQQGQVTVRRSVYRELRTKVVHGATRIDTPDESAWLAEHIEPSPLALQVYQAYRYPQVPFELELSSEEIQSKFEVEHQTLLKLSQRDSALETRLLVQPKQRSIHRVVITAPTDWPLEMPELASSFEWSLETLNDRQRLQIYLADGKSQAFSIILRGKLSQPIDVNRPLEIPLIEVEQCENQYGTIVVQSDPAYDVRGEGMAGCETQLLSSVYHWLAPNQRDSARLAIRFDQIAYRGNLRVSQRASVVTSQSVTNVKLTDRAIEETILIESNVRGAGIREFSFLLPTRLATSKIQAPRLRQQEIISVDNRTDVVRVLLTLQDDLLGQFRVVIEDDRELTSAVQAVPVPIIETGTTDRRIITLENASRDEIVVKDLKGVERLDRAQLLQSFPNDLLGGKSSEAYIVLDSDSEPTLTYETNFREMLSTVGARIGLSHALVVVDEIGTYRAMQELRIENRTEPFLEIELPPESRLWTVSVAGEPVKPASVKDAPDHNGLRIRIPLVKTAEGDLDYPVVLKYGGQLPPPGWFKRMEIPFIRTININVELSQVRLRLPESYQWFNFDGTLGRVESEGDLQAGWLSFRTRQLSELTQLIGPAGSKNPYSQARASNNLKQLEQSLSAENREQMASQSQSLELQKQVSANSAALQNAQQQVQQFDQEGTTIAKDNRDILNSFYESQFNGRSLNALDALGRNFAVDSAPATNAPVVQEEFQSQWFSKNKLDVDSPADIKGRRLKEEALGEMSQSQREALQVPVLEEAKKSNLAQSKSDLSSQVGSGVASQAKRYADRLQRQVDGITSESSARANSRTVDELTLFGTDELRDGFERDYEDGERQRGSVRADTRNRGMDYGGLGGMGMIDNKSVPLSQEDRFGGEAPRSGPSRMVGALASLDVSLPVRGQEFFFSTPRGGAKLSVQSFSSSVYRRTMMLLGILMLSFVAWKAYQFGQQLIQTRLGTRVAAIATMLFGTASIILGFMPVYGVMLILAAIVLALKPVSQRTTQPTLM